MNLTLRLTLFLSLFVGVLSAQEQYPKVITFTVNSNDDSTESSYKTEHYLMINQHEAVDLGPFGNEDCEFDVIAHNGHKVVLTFNQPSQLSGKGRCASGTERGFLSIEINENNTIGKSQMFVIESCLLSLEITEEKNDEKLKAYVVEDLNNSETHSILVNIDEALVFKKD